MNKKEQAKLFNQLKHEDLMFEETGHKRREKTNKKRNNDKVETIDRVYKERY